jgi:hypothetical protein
MTTATPDPAISIEGGLLPADLLDQIADGTATGQRPADFGLEGGRLADVIQAAFSDTRAYWDAFQRRLAAGRATDRLTSVTREAWVMPLLETLGFGPEFQRQALSAGGETFAISHRLGTEPDAPPVHIVAFDQSLDRREGGARSPHALVQGYLNRSDALWGLLTNGVTLRLLRDSARVTRPSYIEFDVRAIVEGNRYSAFVLLYRLLHASRFPRGHADAPGCLLEQWYQAGIDAGGRVREHLRDGVEHALTTLGRAFLRHPASGALRAAVAEGRLTEAAYYRQLLRLIYRLLFLMVGEERRLLTLPDAPSLVYDRYYSVTRLRARCERPFAADRHADLWDGLVQTFRVFREEDAAHALGVTVLNGELFGADACPDLEAAACTNRELLAALFRLSTFREGRVRRRVNYAALDVEELGSVYESLLDFHPRVDLGGAGGPEFELATGSERKQTGSYYTPPALVRELIESALVPVIEERLRAARTREEQRQALLDLRVVDPASGSGHFLLAAARRIARELGRVETGEAEPPPEVYRACLRDVIRHCVYAVDKNPLAVDLCKVALWIEGHAPGLPLSFLDHHVKGGDALVGVFDLDVLEAGIPDAAYEAVTGDDRAVARELKKRNAAERKGTGQLALAMETAAVDVDDLAPDFAALADLEERTPTDVRAKEALYAELRGTGTRWWDERRACDLWTAAFFAPKQTAPGALGALVPTTADVRTMLANPGAAHGQLVGLATDLGQRLGFFHWPLEFPEVFARGGFDVVLGNPPWEQLQPEEIKFFAAIAPEIASLAGARRKAAIDGLRTSNPTLAAAWDNHRREIENETNFVRGSDRFPLTAVGKINTYSVFAELARGLAAPHGRAGVIVPSGIATDDTTKLFFADVSGSAQLASLYDFENAVPIFPGVHRSYKFSLLTMAGSDRPARAARFAFFLHQTDQLRDPERVFTLTADEIALLNPNTRTCPIFRTRRDADLTIAIYRRVPVLIDETRPGRDGNPWGVSFRQGLFNMTSDSGLFRTRDWLEDDGWRLAGNVFERGDERMLPLYEAKLLHQFDHRFATYLPDGDPVDLTPAEHADPDARALPRYWVPEREVEAKLADRSSRGWLLGWRDICRSTDERTVIVSVLPRVGVGHKAPLVIPGNAAANQMACLYGNLTAFVLDYVARQKVGGTSLTYFYLKQITVLSPDRYTTGCPWAARGQVQDWITPRVLELTYTAWDLAPFARDLGYDGPPFVWDEARRFQLRCELDAAFFHLYGVAREDAAYIMDTFPIVRRKDERAYGEYRTRRVILDVYDALASATPERPYVSPLDPPPGDPRAAHAPGRAVVG